MKTWILTLALLLSAPATAAPHDYALDMEQTQVTFSWFFGKDRVVGAIPVKSADMSLDFDAPDRSQIAVTLDAAKAQAGFLFATQALRGPKMFDTDRTPDVTFRSGRVTAQGETVRIDGEVTIRGVTRPATMEATFFRAAGLEPGDLSRVAILLTGEVNRHDFGASGWPDAVGDKVGFRIVAYLDRQ